MPDDNIVHVLDYGLVRLVDHMGSDLSVARAARVSYDAAWRAGEDEGGDARLIRYLWRNQHTTPFEAVEFQFEIKAPIFVLRQWMRHRTWCLAGATPLIFNRPNNGRAYPKSIEEVVRAFSDPAQRARLMGMRLRAPGTAVNITDAWFSGAKDLYTLSTKYGAVTCSADHVFKTPDGEARISESPKYVMALVRAGEKKTIADKWFTSQDIAGERWREFADGYEVSSLGRVRSYWGQGARTKRTEPALKQITINGAGRAVVNIAGRTPQVSHLVFEAFLGSRADAQILHRDDNPSNNRMENLRGGSAADNAADQYDNGGRVFLKEVPAEVCSIAAAGYGDTFDISVTGDHWFCADNLVVHNSYNELSARYRELPNEFYAPTPAVVGTQSETNKQARDLAPMGGAEIEKREREVAAYRARCEASFREYQWLLEQGWPRELARCVLPLSAYSHLFGKCNLHNLFRFLTLRLHPHAQYEIRQYAAAMLGLIGPVVPVCVAAWHEFSDPTGDRK